MIDKKAMPGSKKNKHGAKGKQRKDFKINRVWEYSNYNYENGRKNGIYINDIDFVHYYFANDEAIPAVIIEATKAEFEIGDTYRGSVIKRYSEQGQGKFITTVGEMLGCPVYIVLWHDFQELHIYSFHHKKWKIFNPESWLVYLNKLIDKKKEGEK